MHGEVIKIKRPVIRYHGGKWKLAPWIVSQFPAHRIYVEPYCGGASVLLRKPRSYSECVNDLNSEIVNLFRVLRDAELSHELRRQLQLTPFARDEFRAAYRLVELLDPEGMIEMARRTVVKAFMGFGSAAITSRSNGAAPTGFRSNSNKSGTTPAHDWKNYPEGLEAIVERLRGVVIENKDACEVMLQHDTPQTLHYCDPPYVNETRDKGSDYSHEMTDDDHRELAKVLREMNGMVILSGYPCDLYDKELFPDWYRVERPHLADGARKRTEVLWMNDAAAAQQQKGLFQC